MMRSAERILTTHVGSLPRPRELLAFLEAREMGGDFDQAAFEKRLDKKKSWVAAGTIAAVAIIAARAFGAFSFFDEGSASTSSAH